MDEYEKKWSEFFDKARQQFDLEIDSLSTNCDIKYPKVDPKPESIYLEVMATYKVKCQNRNDDKTESRQKLNALPDKFEFIKHIESTENENRIRLDVEDECEERMSKFWDVLEAFEVKWSMRCTKTFPGWIPYPPPSHEYIMVPLNFDNLQRGDGRKAMRKDLIKEAKREFEFRLYFGKGNVNKKVAEILEKLWKSKNDKLFLRSFQRMRNLQNELWTYIGQMNFEASKQVNGIDEAWSEAIHRINANGGAIIRRLITLDYQSKFVGRPVIQICYC